MTFSLGLVERPEFIYTVNAKMYGEDLIHQIGNAVEFYSGKMVIANSQTQRGFSIRSVLYFGFCNKLKQILNVEILDIFGEMKFIRIFGEASVVTDLEVNYNFDIIHSKVAEV